jgi:hypothetical protein
MDRTTVFVLSFVGISSVFSVVATGALNHGGRPFGAVAARSQITQHVLPQPSTWTPFSAALTITAPGGKVTGHYWRRSDGSWRDEQVHEDGTTYISICNIADAKGYFHYSRGTGWFSRPMILPAEGFLPKRPAIAEQLEHVDPIEGLEVYKHIDPQGLVTYEAQQLNFMPIITLDVRNGVQRVLSNIAVEEQSDVMFRPPAGAPVAVVTTPIKNGLSSGRK